MKSYTSLLGVNMAASAGVRTIPFPNAMAMRPASYVPRPDIARVIAEQTHRSFTMADLHEGVPIPVSREQSFFGRPSIDRFAASADVLREVEQRRTMTSMTDLPFDRDELFTEVNDLVEGHPGTERLGPALIERLASEVTDDLYFCLQTEVAKDKGANISTYYAPSAGYFSAKTRQLAVRMIQHKLSGRERVRKSLPPAVDFAPVPLSPDRKTVRRVTDQLRSLFPKVFEGRQRSDVRAMVSGLMTVDSNQRFFYGERLSVKGLRYFQSIV